MLAEFSSMAMSGCCWHMRLTASKFCKAWGLSTPDVSQLMRTLSMAAPCVRK